MSAVFPIVLLYLFARAIRRPGYGQTLRERFGRLPASFSKTPPGSVWLHAISVGEVVSAAPLIQAIRREMPGVPVFVSVGTLAGRELATQRLGGITDGIFYVPLDYVWCVRRVLRAIRPSLLVVMETEIWPNLWRETRKAGARLLVVNGRISDKALPSYLRLRGLFREVLAEADTILAQTRENVERYRSLGCTGDIRYGGNLKYDFRPGSPSPLVSAWIERLAPSRVWIAASTMPPEAASDPDEDHAVLDAFEQLAASEPGLLLILVPRRPERFETAAAEIARRGLCCVRRSSLDPSTPLQLPGVLLLDTVGELAGLFRLADVVFMGGTLVQRGGHNILEPALAGKPVVTGPDLRNFAEIAADFRRAGALVEVPTPAELAPTVAALLGNDSRRKGLGELSAELARARTGATEIAMAEVRRLHDLGLPRRPLCWWEWPLIPLSWIWRAGAAIDSRRKQRRARALPKPVISIGGIGMGGAGKTPFALYVAKTLRDAGLAPAFLTRGYGRDSKRPVVFDAGAEAPVSLTGDEAQILLRSGLGPVGVGASRFETGSRIAKESSVSLFLLDDGFQHHRLRRDLDLVLIDCLDPLAGGRVFPAGRLREPLASLQRADAFVLTRTQPGRNYASIMALLEGKPVFRASVRPVAWVNALTGEQTRLDALPNGGLHAFCGLGNPDSFRQSLANLAVNAPITGFADHHSYRIEEIAALVTSQTKVLLTTEKDVMNLPFGWEKALTIPVLWLRIEMEMEDEERFRSFVVSRLSPTRPLER